MTDNNNETYLMLDIEVAGPISAYHSMIEFAVCHRSIDSHGTVCLDYFQRALKEFEFRGGVWRWDDTDTSGVQDSTYKWWHAPERVHTLHEIEAEAVDPVEAMHEFKAWLEKKKFRGLTMVAFGPDLEWLKLYWWEVFKSKPPFGLMAVDAKSYAMATCDLEFRHTTNVVLRKRVPFLFKDTYPHTHRALDDAKEQAYMFERLQEMSDTQIEKFLIMLEKFLMLENKLKKAQALLLNDEIEVKRQLMLALDTVTEQEELIASLRNQLREKESNDMEIDPVCGMEVRDNSEFKHTYDGTVYRFCTKDCRDEFVATPDDYVGSEDMFSE